MRRTFPLAGAATVLALGWALAGCGSTSSPAAGSPAVSSPAVSSPAVSSPVSNGSTQGTAGAASPAAVDGVQHLGVEAFSTLVSSPSVVLLDVRTGEEFATGHLAGARLIDFRGADFDARLATLDKAATYAVYCRSGHRSGEALERMSAAGFAHVADLSGGITAWTAAGRPVTTG